MKKRSDYQHKLNNKGMTLVEVLVAIIILSVIGISFLRSFSYASQYNMKAKEKHQALVLAQSLMEGIKAYDMSVVDTQFSNSVTNADFKLYRLANVGGDDVVRSSDGFGKYKLDKVKYNGSTYTVVIEASRSAASGDVVVSGNIGSLNSASEYRDAFFVEPFEDEQTDVLKTVWNHLLSCDTTRGGAYPGVIDHLVPSGTSEDLAFLSNETMLKNLITVTEREMQIDIQETAASSSVNVTVIYKITLADYTYTDSTSGTDFTIPHDIPTVPPEVIFTYTCYDNSTTKPQGVDLDDIYIYYYPAYSTDATGGSHSWLYCGADKITIDNGSANNKNVFLIKQRMPGYTGTIQAAKLNAPDSLYQPIIKRTGVGMVTLYSNLKKRIGSSDDYTATYPTPIGFPDGYVHDTLWFENKDKTLVYDVKISIYDGSELIYTLNGSTNAK